MTEASFRSPTYRIRFAASTEPDRVGPRYFDIVLGPMHATPRRERNFRTGDEAIVEMRPSKYRSEECVDLTFEDGEIAIEVERSWFEIVAEIP